MTHAVISKDAENVLLSFYRIYKETGVSAEPHELAILTGLSRERTESAMQELLENKFIQKAGDN